MENPYFSESPSYPSSDWFDPMLPLFWSKWLPGTCRLGSPALLKEGGRGGWREGENDTSKGVKRDRYKQMCKKGKREKRKIEEE